MESNTPQQIISRIQDLSNQLEIIEKQLLIDIPKGKRDALMRNRTLLREKLKSSARSFKNLFEVPVVTIDYLNSRHERNQYTLYGLKEAEARFSLMNLATILGEDIIILESRVTTTECPKSL